MSEQDITYTCSFIPKRKKNPIPLTATGKSDEFATPAEAVSNAIAVLKANDLTAGRLYLHSGPKGWAHLNDVAAWRIDALDKLRGITLRGETLYSAEQQAVATTAELIR